MAGNFTLIARRGRVKMTLWAMLPAHVGASLPSFLDRNFASFDLPRVLDCCGKSASLQRVGSAMLPDSPTLQKKG
jgi:hypothetical protein